MRLAAIDIGTNSLHMIVAHVRPDLSFEVVDREKEMVRLGAGGLDGRALTPEAMHAARLALSKFRRLAESHGVETIVAAATSATREAENGGEFIRAIERDTGIRVRVISGTEEARLIHLAAAYGVGVPGEQAIVIDIGGGSVEITRGTGPDVTDGRSFKVGVIRLTEQFVTSDPLSARDERRLVRHIEEETGPYLDGLRRSGFGRVIGTSGTILSLGAVAAQADRSTVRNQRVSARQLHRVRKALVALDLEGRLRVPGLVLCDLSLREGLVLDYIDQHRRDIARADRYPDIRRRSVMELAERSHFVAPHATQVARLALALFDATREQHGLGAGERECLEYAALLHDIGVHISFEQHHRHTEYMVQHGDLRGFEPREVTMMALVARYHRRAEPSKRHRAFAALDKPTRHAVRALAAMLRLAEGLDRSHSQPVRSLALDRRGPECVVRLDAAGDAELELWSAPRHASAFEAFLGQPVRFEARPVPHPESTPDPEWTRGARPTVRRGHDRPQAPAPDPGALRATSPRSALRKTTRSAIQ